MYKLFESFRNYSLLVEDQLLVEGRKENAAKKYPELAKKREGLDGESVLDTLIQADPSGNQKYLLGAAKLVNTSLERAKTDDYEIFWGKKWPEGDTDNLVSAWGVARNVAELLPKFHKLQPYVSTDKRDINTNKNWGEFSTVVAMAAQKKRDKEEKRAASERERTQAGEESTIVADNDYYTMIRPESALASCYYGKGTKWCISATQASNYFDEYTKDGKSFYFVFFSNLSNANPFKKVALVVAMDGNYEEAFNAEDDSLYPREVVDAIIQNLLHEKEDAGALMVYRWYDNDRYADELSDKDKADYVKKVKELGIVWDDELATSEHLFKEEAEEANHSIRVLAERAFGEMKQEAETTHLDNPPGPTEEDYNEVLAKYELDLNHIGISLEMPYDTGASQTYWNAYLSVDIEDYVKDNRQRLKWKKSEEQIVQEEDELRQAVDLALNTVDIWPDNMEEEYNNPFEYHVNLDPGSGTPDDFEGYMDNIQYLDDRFAEGFAEALLEELVDRDLLGRDQKEEEYWPDPEEKKKQLELPFEKGTEEGAQVERDLDYIRSPQGAALRRRVGLRENKIRIKIRRIETFKTK